MHSAYMPLYPLIALTAYFVIALGLFSLRARWVGIARRRRRGEPAGVEAARPLPPPLSSCGCSVRGSVCWFAGA